MKESIYSLSVQEVTDRIKELGLPSFRTKQLLDWLYTKFVTDPGKMSNIPAAMVNRLSEGCSFQLPAIVHSIGSIKGGSVKFAYRSGEDLFESVILFAQKRRTLCVSSQIGCALGCTFCETGKLGFVRNLQVHEIIGQIIRANEYLKENNLGPITNIVFMGMGEALSNFDNFRKALAIITDEKQLAIGTRKITVSTAGVVHNIRKMIDHNIQVGLAISLNASSDEERSEIMPINNRYNIEELIDVAKEYSEFRGRPVTFEYVVIDGKNDSTEAASRLIRLLKRIPCKLNLIPLNDCSTEGLKRPEESCINQFSKLLHNGGLTVTVRRSGGQDIDGACGQLAGKLSKDYL